LFDRHPEPEVWKVIKKIKGGNFIDVGANQGLVYVFRLRKHFRTVCAIEPNPKLADWMRGEIVRRWWDWDDDGWSNIQVWQFAASNENGKTGLHIGWNLGASTIMPSNDPPTIVETRRLDDWWRRERIRLMIMDVERAEFKALGGATRILDLTDNIVVELHMPDQKGHLEGLLHVHGFNLRWLDDTHIYGSRA
jgi:FkbM family methyltransferase